MTERKQAGVDADCILVIPVFTCYDQGRIPGRTGAGMAERVNTGTLMKRLIKTKHLEAFLKNNEKYMEVPSFTDLLARRCREKELVPEQVILRSGLDRTYGHQLFNGTRRPSRDKVLQLRTREELESFLKENALQLGKMHNTAFRLYQEYMKLLKTAAMDDLMPPDREMSTEEILEMYLFNHLIPRNKKGSKTREPGKGAPQDFVLREAIRRDIKQNWPDQYELSRMENRTTDVTRKTLILLFLACDGGESEYGDYSESLIDYYYILLYYYIFTLL